MNRNYITNIFNQTGIVLFTVLFITSCETVIDIDPPEYTPRLVVHSISHVIDGEASISVQVTQTVGIFEESKDVKSATLSLSWPGHYYETSEYLEENLGIIDTLCYYEENELNCEMIRFKYFQNYRFPKLNFPINTPITLRVSAPGFTDAIATTIIPELIRYDSLIVLPEQVLNQFGDRVNAIDIFFRPKEDGRNYHYLELVEGQRYLNELEVNTMYLESIDPAVVNNEGLLAISNENFGGQDRKLRATYYSWHSREGSFALWSSITREAFLFNKSVQTYNESVDNPFTTLASLFSNVENGHGFFGLYNTRIERVK
jgi:hypothetical protein